MTAGTLQKQLNQDTKMNESLSLHIDRFSLEHAERKISYKGVMFNGLRYTSPLLLNARQTNRFADRAIIYFDRDDLSHIYLFEQNGPGVAAIPCSHFRYAKGLALKEHLTVFRYCRRFGIDPDEGMQLRILYDIRSGTFDPDCRSYFGSPANVDGKEDYRQGQDGSYYRELMAKLGSAVRNFESGEAHV